MGYVIFKLLDEDEKFLVYRYSHGCDIFDGMIMIKKEFSVNRGINEFFKSNINIVPSSTDKGTFFAVRVVIFLWRLRKKKTKFPEKHILAYG